MTTSSAIERKKNQSRENRSSSTKECEIGLIGLGVMGRNFLLNIADHGYAVAGYDKEGSQVDALAKEKNGQEIYSANKIEDFLDSLRTPRAILMLVPAGDAVDSVIDELEDHLDPGDVLIDAGNSYFKDTNLR
ncbi:MAG: NAD(P)-binding domain-containing protein, partial [Candidatus Omnitrophica bacterium]|nr:NAD(P)-binding domain-containing protein [Candidatus Omnitrophota bacterium]